jgi:molybdopterin/thiamine biosynthesis adenylyltransferase
LASPLESCAILIANVAKGETRTRYLIQGLQFPPDSLYRQRTEFSAILEPAFVVQATKSAQRAHQAVIFVHTHPDTKTHPQFSTVDDSGEVALKEFMARRIPGVEHVALVLSQSGCAARLLGTTESVRVLEIGRNLNIRSESENVETNPEFGRQVQAFGKIGQQKIQRLRVGIVGLGGTGSIVAQQLAYLGVKEFLLIDPDAVERSNLNRLIGAGSASIGKPKVEVAAELLQFIQPSVLAEQIKDTALRVTVARKLIDTDFFFCCTDTHGSRAILAQLAYQYLIPAIDMGVIIATRKGRVSHITGRAQMLSPGLGCLTCGQVLDADAVRWDFMSEEDRNRDPYFSGAGEAQPSVVTINSLVASLATNMFLGAVTDVPAQSRFEIYNGIEGTVRSIQARCEAACIVCSDRGALGRGDTWPLPGRLQ